MDSMDFMEIHGLHGFHWKSMDSMQSMEIHGCHRKSMDCMEIHGLHGPIELRRILSSSAEIRRALRSPTPSGVSKANSGDDHIECGGVSQASSGHDVTRDRDLAAKPESQSQNDHTNGGV